MNDTIASYYSALANPVRLAIFLHIANESEGFVPDSPNKESCVTQISKTLQVPQPTVSNHLRILKNAGLVKSVSIDTHCYQYVTKQAAEALLQHAKYISEQSRKNPF